MCIVPSLNSISRQVQDLTTPVLDHQGFQAIEIEIGGGDREDLVVNAFQRIFPVDANSGVVFRRSGEQIFENGAMQTGVWLRDYWFLNPLNGEKLSCPSYGFYSEAHSFDPFLQRLYSGQEGSLFPKGQIVDRGYGGGQTLQFITRRDPDFTYLKNLYLEGGNLQFFDFQGKRGMLLGASAILHSANLMKNELTDTEKQSPEIIFNKVLTRISDVFQMDPKNILVLAHSELHIDLEVSLAPEGKVFLSDPTATHEMDCSPLSRDRIQELKEIYQYNKGVLEKFGFQVFPMPRDFYIGDLDRSYCFNGLFFHDKKTNVSVFTTNALTMWMWRSEYSNLESNDVTEVDLFKSRFDGLSIDERIYNYLRSHGILTFFIPRMNIEGGGVRCISREIRTKQSFSEPLHYIPFNSDSLQKFMPARLFLSCKGQLPTIQLQEQTNNPVEITLPEKNKQITNSLIFDSIQTDQSKLIEVCVDGKTLFRRVLYPGTVTCLKISPSIIAESLRKFKQKRRCLPEDNSRMFLEDNSPDGRVAFILENGDQYTGEFQNGFIHGSGTLIYTDGCRYEGKFEKGLAHGRGTVMYPNGAVYVGTFECDLRHGHGRYIRADQEIYFGGYKDDLQNGYGIVIFPNNHWKECEFKDGELIKTHKDSSADHLQFGRHASGDWYNCQIVNGEFHGRGLYYFHNRDEYYIGDFKNNLRDGQGTVIYANGDYYRGDFKANVREGQGTLVYANGDRYEGEFKNDLRDGHGTLIYANGDRYEGEFKYGQIQD